MKTIWKFPLGSSHHVTLQMPEDAVALSVQTQFGQPVLWAMLDPSEPPVDREIFVFGTGHEMPDYPGVFIGTFQVENGAYVLHVFENT